MMSTDHRPRKHTNEGPLDLLPMIAVVGNVEPPLLRAFVDHYQAVGITDFLLAFHFTDDVDRADSAELLSTCRDVVGPPRLVTHGVWLETTNTELRDQLRAQAGPGWHIIADIDEFHFYPSGLQEFIDEAESCGQPTVEGVLFDRISSTGHLSPWSEQSGLDESYPLGGFFSHLISSADSRKVMAARSDIPLGSGNHWAPGLRIGAGSLPPLPVHHFKWRAGCLEYLRRRAESFRDSTVQSEIDMRSSCEAVIQHVNANTGRIAVDDPVLAFHACNLKSFPTEWENLSSRVSEYWWRARWRETKSTPLQEWISG